MRFETRKRDPETQVCPDATKAEKRHPATASLIGASSKTTTGVLPPSSRVQGTSRSAAAAAIALPVLVPPVMSMRATLRFDTSAAPISPPPATTLTTPGGIPASAHQPARIRGEIGASSEGLMTVVLPAARA